MISKLWIFHFDSTIRLWELSGQVLLEMVGHTSIVYSVDAHASGLIVSGSEDHFAKIWKGNIVIHQLLRTFFPMIFLYMQLLLYLSQPFG